MRASTGEEYALSSAYSNLGRILAVPHTPNVRKVAGKSGKCASTPFTRIKTQAAGFHSMPIYAPSSSEAANRREFGPVGLPGSSIVCLDLWEGTYAVITAAFLFRVSAGSDRRTEGCRLRWIMTIRWEVRTLCNRNDAPFPITLGA